MFIIGGLVVIVGGVIFIGVLMDVKVCVYLLVIGKVFWFD